MSITVLKIIPQNWDCARDVPFFRITANEFPSTFCFGSSVLLASYDDEFEQSNAAVRHRGGHAQQPLHALAAHVPATA